MRASSETSDKGDRSFRTEDTLSRKWWKVENVFRRTVSRAVVWCRYDLQTEEDYYHNMYSVISRKNMA